jgi:hypothetical protein
VALLGFEELVNQTLGLEDVFVGRVAVMVSRIACRVGGSLGVD